MTIDSAYQLMFSEYPDIVTVRQMCDEVLRIGFFVQPQILENADFGNTVDSPDSFFPEQI